MLGRFAPGIRRADGPVPVIADDGQKYNTPVRRRLSTSTRNSPGASIFGLIALLLSVGLGLFVHRQGYGTGPDGIFNMLLGIGIGLVGCFVSLIFEIISLSRSESPAVLGVIALMSPIVLFFLCVSQVIRL